MQAIQAGLVDSAPDMRAEAAAALVTRKDGRSTATLLHALDSEKDEQVQAAFLLALGKLATPEAVQRLIKCAEAERGLFKRKTGAYRVAAVHGLSEARTAEATDALRALQADKDDEVREAAKQAIARITRRPTAGERPAIS
jgi:HEAT repeat protein